MTKRINRESGRFHLVKMLIGTIFLFAMLVWPDMAVCAEGDTVTLSGSGTLTRQYVEENLGDATEVIISGFSEIEDDAFIECSSLTKVTIPNSVTKFGYRVFYGCDNLKTAGPIGGGYNIEFEWTDAIPAHTFFNCKSLESVTIPDSVKTIGNIAFGACSNLSNVTIPNSVTSIETSAFYGCTSFTSITIPNSITRIESSIFFGCSNLTSVTIPDSVTDIWESAFKNCSSLTNITIKGNAKLLGDEIFEGCNNVTISGYTGTKVEEYTKDHGIPFVSLGKCETVFFDDTSLSGSISYDEKENGLQYIVDEPYGVFPGIELSSGYAFDGWYLDKECTRRVTINDIFQSGNNTLYAKSVSTEEIENGFANIDDTYYWYEGGVKQGTYDDPKGVVGDGTVRGREIYDPDSDGWYWLDACYDGAKACNKEVWMPYIYQDEDDWDEEELQRNADASGLMSEQVKKAILDKDGKWVRYDENGKMYKGWYDADASLYPKQAGNRYYYDQKTGLMAKGWLNIDGVDYHFDETTGALIR